ncbi:hypothetical protein BATDEDRAFT_89941 [Batrachochytrium dendrobatidis JAM81]|uniref:Transmembrane protein n=2 Tax=Batrachochytrium dendrobatidis TaxID=109871 RepID=F4P6B2_BATDJ|nr:uncharacterized protein BATDEDRAFT_89941 [Batrachochytrium dendrobatidis JAM81]EGF79318.1 hypothetical protein BATDEDRAFT_89941 [Batrachochytrium dendrobatidis JAM81]|eukprot:XP_006680096.1 hypothetical protein BATDEDRAFT_89941 [Batrachochytrium dendrobatidis JAM81]
MIPALGGAGGWANWSLTVVISIACTVATGAVVVAATSMLLRDHNQTVLRNEFKLRYRKVKALLRAIETEFFQILPQILMVEAASTQSTMAATVNLLMAISPAAETPVSLSASLASSQPSNYNDEISDSSCVLVNPDCSTLLSATKPEPSTTVSKPASMGEALPVQVMPLSPLPDSPNAVAGLNAKLSSPVCRQTMSASSAMGKTASSCLQKPSHEGIRNIGLADPFVSKQSTHTSLSNSIGEMPLTLPQLTKKLAMLDDQIMRMLERLDDIKPFALAPPGLVLESQQSRIQLQSSLAATHITASSSQPAAVVAGMAVAAQNAFLLLLDAFGAGTVKPELLHAASLNASSLDHLETTNVQLDTKTHRVIMDGIDVVARSKNILSKTLHEALGRIDRACDTAGIAK